MGKKAIEETQKFGFISSIFTISKKSGGFRPVVNLKALNKFVVYNHFKMEGLPTLKSTYVFQHTPLPAIMYSIAFSFLYNLIYMFHRKEKFAGLNMRVWYLFYEFICPQMEAPLQLS